MSEQNAPPRQPRATPRRPWIAPTVVDLPRLENLTLQTGGGIDGDANGSVFA